jgi:hypothetical protein
MDAARGLHHGAFRVEFDDDIIEIAGTLFGRAQIKVKERAVGAFLAVNCQKFTGDSLHYASASGYHYNYKIYWVMIPKLIGQT